MRCETIRTPIAARQSNWRDAIAMLTALWAAAIARHGSRIDLDNMSERMKRDLGFLDGRARRYEDDFPRW